MSQTDASAGLAASAAPAARPKTAAIPFKTEDAGPVTTLPSLLVGLVLLGLAAWLVLRGRFKRSGLAARTQHARVLESHRLGPRGSVVVVQFDGQLHLIAVTEQAVTCVARSEIGAPT